MSTSSPPPASKAPPGPLAPPEEQFWERYSPHYEFPLSSVGSVALHIAALVLFLGALWLLSRMTLLDTTPVPMRAVSVAGEGDAAEGSGAGGHKTEDVTPDVPQERPIPDARLNEVKEDIKEFLPKVPSSEVGLRPEDLPAVRDLAKLSDDLRRKLLQGSGNKGAGGTGGTGTAGVEGKGSGTQGDPASAANRAVRWELNFNTATGEEHLAHLAAMKATLVFPLPPDWKASKAYRDLRPGRASGEDYSRDQLPALYFVDEEAQSAGRLAKTLGLDFAPPIFIAFFPKEIEEELAAKERAFRGRKEGEIFSTKFRVLLRDGKPSITVIEQIPARLVLA